MNQHITGESGITIIEILIAVVIFMAGFSVLIALMNGTLIRFSTKELLTADNLAHEVIVETLAANDTTTVDTSIVRSGLQFRVVKTVEVEPRLAKVSVTVFRQKNNRKLTELYDAFVLPQ